MNFNEDTPDEEDYDDDEAEEASELVNLREQIADQVEDLNEEVIAIKGILEQGLEEKTTGLGVVKPREYNLHTELKDLKAQVHLLTDLLLRKEKAEHQLKPL